MQGDERCTDQTISVQKIDDKMRTRSNLGMEVAFLFRTRESRKNGQPTRQPERDPRVQEAKLTVIAASGHTHMENAECQQTYTKTE